MSKFKPSDFDIKGSKEKAAEVRVVKLSAPQKPVVQQFGFNPLKEIGRGDYANIKKKLGVAAATDTQSAARSRKDSRFNLNPLLKDHLSVEEEERRAIEEKVRARVFAVAEEAKAQAASVGYEAGLKKGYDEAFAKFQAEGKARLEQFSNLVNACERAKEEIFRENERFLIELIYRVAKMVLLKELSVDREYLLRLSRSLIERIGVRENITVRINPSDAETANMLKEGLDKALGGLKNLNVEVSNHVQQGGVAIETEWNAIDACVETQLQGLYNALIGKESGG